MWWSNVIPDFLRVNYIGSEANVIDTPFPSPSFYAKKLGLPLEDSSYRRSHRRGFLARQKHQDEQQHYTVDPLVMFFMPLSTCYAASDGDHSLRSEDGSWVAEAK
ncbi:MAG TPA: hypothetical protein VHQ22_08495 [Terriglobales bacterium]|jgi:hypothetical protein|nr:hypothetical protein [Terriglobales bacterium]